MIPKDKLMHAGVGLIASIFAGGVWLLGVASGVAPIGGLPLAIALAALMVGLAKEGADAMDNRITPGMHSVDVWDAVATTLPGVVLGLVAAQVLA